MPICPKCHNLISESHFQRHLKRCGTSRKHRPQSLYVPSATAQIESPNRGITYGPPSSSYARKPKWLRQLIWVVVAALLIGVSGFIISVVFGLL